MTEHIRNDRGEEEREEIITTKMNGASPSSDNHHQHQKEERELCCSSSHKQQKEEEEEEPAISVADWPPEGYESRVIRIIPPIKKETTAAPVEDGVVIEYEGKTLALQTILEEDELAPLFDGAYWPGTMVWPVSLWTAEYLHHHYRHQMPQAKFVELGCGCGVPGMLAQLNGASVALTEQPELMRIIDVNIKANFGDKPDPPIFSAPLFWSREAAKKLMERRPGWDKVDFVVCCDCVYAPFWGDSYKALLACMEELCNHPEAIGIISVERRNADGVDDFLSLAHQVMQVEEKLVDRSKGWFLYELRPLLEKGR